MLHARTVPKREYFFDVDRDGRLWHDGTVLDDAAALDALFRRLVVDPEHRHASHPFVSPCAGERNYVRAAVTPVVFTRLGADDRLGWAASLTVAFEPGRLSTCGAGMLYHPAPVGGVGLLAARLVGSLADRLVERGGTIGFVHAGRWHPISRGACDAAT